MGVTHPYLARRVDEDTTAIFTTDLRQLLTIDGATANRTTITGTTTPGDGLRFKCGGNSNQILFYGGAINEYTATGTHQFNTTVKILNGILTGGTDGDVYLSPNGTGKVKFGTLVGTGDVLCNGHIVINDAAGNPQKLMTTA